MNLLSTPQVGHWMGLYHTFGLDGSCDGPGDYISDTSAHSEATRGCTGGDDAIIATCPGESSDHVNNFMDYSDDVVSNEVRVVVVVTDAATLQEVQPIYAVQYLYFVFFFSIIL